MKRPNILVNMCADMFHIGHLNIIYRANLYGNVIVGLHNDETILEYKGKLPVIPQYQRAMIVRSCRYVYDVIENLPHEITKDFLNKYDIQYIVHGDDINEVQYKEVKEKLIILPRTLGISSTEIKEKAKI